VDRQNRVPIIFDTDMDTDCDDAGALAVLHALASCKETDILAVVCNAPTPWGVPCIRAINSYYNRAQIPTASWTYSDLETDPDFALYRQLLHDQFADGERLYNKHIAQTFPTNSMVEALDGVSLYRKVLSEQPDGSVVIAAVGFLNVLAELLKSGPDRYSELSGMELVRSKVKELVTMAGAVFPEGKEGFNWKMHAPSAEYVVREWPGPITVSSYGTDVLTGQRLSYETPAANPVRKAYEIYLQGEGKNRSSWDQLAVLYAVRGENGIFRKETGYSLQFDAETYQCQWQPSANDNRAFIVPIISNEELSKHVEDLMVFQD
jgi:inosine-uridine nucleoside N-ribohydrolase